MMVLRLWVVKVKKKLRHDTCPSSEFVHSSKFYRPYRLSDKSISCGED